MKKKAIVVQNYIGFFAFWVYNSENYKDWR